MERHGHARRQSCKNKKEPPVCQNACDFLSDQEGHAHTNEKHEGVGRAVAVGHQTECRNIKFNAIVIVKINTMNGKERLRFDCLNKGEYGTQNPEEKF